MEDRQAVATSSVEHLPVWDEADSRLLDHASALIAARGTGGLTIAELAREARVSRPTIYRRWAGVDEVVRAALLRQTVSILSRFSSAINTREDLVDEILRFADEFAANPVFARLLARESEVFTQYSLERVGSSQRVMLRWLADAIVRGQQGGSVRKGDADDMSVMLLLIVQSAVLSHNAVSSLIGASEWRAELTCAVDGYLRT